MKKQTFLAKLRLNAGLSQTEVADKLGYTSQLISLWESGKTAPDLSVVSKYASILKVDLEGFIKQKIRNKNSNCNELSFNIDSFSKNLRKLRKSSGLSQSEVAEKIGTNIKTIGSWENGLSTPSIENFVKLCSLYKVSFDELYFVIDNPLPVIRQRKLKVVIPIVASAAVVLTIGGVATGFQVDYIFKRMEQSSIERSISIENETNYPEHNHEFYYVTIKTADYESEGLYIKKCYYCDLRLEVVTPVLQHKFRTEYDSHYHWEACKDEGYTFIKRNVNVHNFSFNPSDPFNCRDCNLSVSTMSNYYVGGLCPTDTEVYDDLVFSKSTLKDYYVIVHSVGVPFNKASIKIDLLNDEGAVIEEHNEILSFDVAQGNISRFIIPKEFFLSKDYLFNESIQTPYKFNLSFPSVFDAIDNSIEYDVSCVPFVVSVTL